MTEALMFAAGAVFGGLVAVLVLALRRRDEKAVARELAAQAEERKAQDLEALMARVRDSFGSLSLEALRRNTDEFLKLAESRLSEQTKTGAKEMDGQRRLIDQNIDNIRREMAKVEQAIGAIDKSHLKTIGELNAKIQAHYDQTCQLRDTTQDLRQALVSTKERGQWGERMAEDILRMAGFEEGVNYLKQKTDESGTSRPDFTFLLPQGRRLNMDVKFPLSSYIRSLEADDDGRREGFEAQFLRDVRERVKEVSGKDYINPGQGTLDYVLVFIPNEQVYGFIHRRDPGLLDEALRRKVVLCSPFTVFAVLAIIRQAMDSFTMEKAASEMLRLFGAFAKQWKAFTEALDKLGKKIEEASGQFDTLRTTRYNQLSRPLGKIEQLRKDRGLEEAALIEGEADVLPDEAEPGDGGGPA